ncbi:hypothetical protein ABBQ38_013722 [Trebouxia sp. C0009 RCD-2024]
MERQALTQRDPDLSEDFRVYDSAEAPPWKAIYLAVGLLVAGTVLLFTGIGLWATDPKAHGFVLFTLGLIIFIPGFYFSRIAYYAYKGHPGYTFDVIPAV